MTGPACKCRPERADRQHRDELEGPERVVAFAREELQREQLDGSDSGDGRAEDERAPPQPAADEEERQEDEAQEHERERAEAERQCRGASGGPAAPPLQSAQRAEPCREPEGIAVGPEEDRAGREHAKDASGPAPGRAPLALDQGREERGGKDNCREHERQIPDQRGRQVVEEAVGGERIVPAVPEVVPDEHALPDEQRPVEVGRGVAGLRSQYDEKGCDGAGERAGKQRLPAR